MVRNIRLYLVVLVLLVAGIVLPGCADRAAGALDLQNAATSQSFANAKDSQKKEKSASVKEDGTYTSKEDVALYLHTYGRLPSNFVTKEEAEDAGWKTEGLSLDEACPGKSIGGDRFSNREGRLPKKKGRTWYECDIGYKGGSRGAQRLVYSSDGLIYYTKDHYRTFEKLY